MVRMRLLERRQDIRCVRAFGLRRMQSVSDTTGQLDIKSTFRNTLYLLSISLDMHLRVCQRLGNQTHRIGFHPFVLYSVRACVLVDAPYQTPTVVFGITDMYDSIETATFVTAKRPAGFRCGWLPRRRRRSPLGPVS